ncbi:conserved hypothetical protein [Candidatus Sulfobium mesophilum]|uniref:Ig-like domain-containing protein n=1 Tax=Candidatus Sulfobium mesophilum TaxID=2016548 RepID=A0A2U3QKU8_9BACT|nr:conserved hypothetical protein [Candidatus Sulfobium mesophilum]
MSTTRVSNLWSNWDKKVECIFKLDLTEVALLGIGRMPFISEGFSIENNLRQKHFFKEEWSMKMKSSKIFFIALLVVVTMLLMSTAPVMATQPSCSNVNAIINPGNQTVPEASVVNGVRTPTIVTLDGSNSNPKGALKCEWASVSAPSIVLSTSCTYTFTAPEVGPSGAAFGFQLKVTETQTGCTDKTDSKTTTINVTNVITETNRPPVAIASVQVNDVLTNVANEGDSVTLDGTGSSDPDPNTELSYSWAQIVNGTETPFSTDAITTFTAPEVPYPDGASLTFRLTVSDGSLSNTTSDIIVTVKWLNEPPVAEVSCPVSVKEGETVNLVSTSFDNDGDGIASYAWIQNQGLPNADLSRVDLSQPSISFPAPQLTSQYHTMKFQLTVTDNGLPNSTNDGLSDSAACDVEVLDITNPSIQCNVPDDAIWYGSDVTINCTATDVASGLADDNDASFVLKTSVPAGDETGSASTNSKENICDTVNNCIAAVGPYTFKVDRKAPTVSCGTADNAWHATDQSVTCTATDSGSGPASQTVILNTSVAAGTETSNAYTDSQSACDLVGNCSPAGPVTGFKIDRREPQPIGCDSPDGQWHSSDVTLKCHYADGGSGPSTLDVSLTTSVANGSETDNAAASANGFQACDAVNNCAASPSDIVGNKIDKKAPTDITFDDSTISDGGSYYFGFVPPAPTCNATDKGSGLNSCIVTGYNTKVGSHTLTATATDNVGNTSTATLTYTVMAWTLTGFFQPVDMNGVWNTVKNGSTVPLKFQVFAGPTELTDVAVIDTFSVTSVVCPKTGYVADDIEFTTTGNTTLRYDTASYQFIQNWQTPKKPGACYQVMMTTDDGSNLKATFILK